MNGGRRGFHAMDPPLRDRPGPAACAHGPGRAFRRNPRARNFLVERGRLRGDHRASSSSPRLRNVVGPVVRRDVGGVVPDTLGRQRRASGGDLPGCEDRTPDVRVALAYSLAPRASAEVRARRQLDARFDRRYVMTQLETEVERCRCGVNVRHPKVIALTGQTSGGKTRLLETIRNSLCSHVGLLPESASSSSAEVPAQRAAASLTRGTADDLSPAGRTRADGAGRGLVRHRALRPRHARRTRLLAGRRRRVLRPARNRTRVGASSLRRGPAICAIPGAVGYDTTNPLRIESAIEASALDEKIALGLARLPAPHRHRCRGDVRREARRRTRGSAQRAARLLSRRERTASRLPPL